MRKKYVVVRWEIEIERHIYRTLWKGNSKQKAIVIAAYAFGKAIVEAQCFAQKLLNPWDQELDMKYAKEIKARFTVLKECNRKKEASDEIPEVVASFGDDSIEISQRINFD